ncbi:MAG: hypothetical protein ACR2PL_21210 [Dehalococcoidia bacterium]
MTTKELSETEKLERVPGIIFADGAAGRRARIAGTGWRCFNSSMPILPSEVIVNALLMPSTG